MFQTTPMSNSSYLSGEASASSAATRVSVHDLGCLQSITCVTTDHHHHQESKKIKKKRNLPGNPDPDAEVIALSPRTLLATNRFICEVCNKGFQRDQNLQLHRRGHNLPWKLKQRSNKEVKKKAYVCPEPSCVHHHPSRALGDLTGIKKHFCRKHGEKKFKCDKCSKIYAVYSDWKAHSKTCGTREYRCDCGTLFSRKDSFVTHRAFCDALAEESARLSATTAPLHHQLHPLSNPQTLSPAAPAFPFSSSHQQQLFSSVAPTTHNSFHQNPSMKAVQNHHSPSLQKACTMMDANVSGFGPLMGPLRLTPEDLATWQRSDHLTRDFLGLTGPQPYTAAGGGRAGGAVNVSMNVHDVLKYAGGLDYAVGVGGPTIATTSTIPPMLERDRSMLNPQQQHPSFGFAAAQTWHQLN